MLIQWNTFTAQAELSSITMTASKKARSGNDSGDDQGFARIRKHKFESFTQRIAQLKIDPIRRNRNQELERDEIQSHFRNGLNHWKELNLAERFCSFVKEVEPLCDSLLQVLHHRTAIVELLLRYLEERNILSLEPLLNLTSCLTHDLGVRFEEYFPSVLTLVLDIASKHRDIEAVEWSFSCLAWLFKYLSRLLVPDLRPTYDLVAKSLGKENHKPFIARFAAEALSFLVRKAASVYSKDPEPLNRIVIHILADLDDFGSETKHFVVYKYGIMSLFANTIKGLGAGFHSVAPDVFKCLLQKVSGQNSRDMLLGVLTNSIHHGDADTTAPIMNIVYTFIDNLSANSHGLDLVLSLNLLSTIVVVRHGTRVGSWHLVFQQTSKLVEISNRLESPSKEEVQMKLGQAAAIAFSNATEESCIAHIRLLSLMSNTLSAKCFIALCAYLAELSRNRFSHFLLSLFLKRFTNCQSDTEITFLVAALQISDLSIKLDNDQPLQLTYQEHLIDLFRNSQMRSPNVSLIAGYVELFAKLHITELNRSKLAELSCNILQNDSLVAEMDDRSRRFWLGSGMQFALRYASIRPTWEQLMQNFHTVKTMSVYLDNLRCFLLSIKVEISPSSVLDVVSEVAKNLSSPSKNLRRVSLQLLKVIFERYESQQSGLINSALELEDLTLDVKSARTAAMNVRRLAEQYRLVMEGSWLVEVVPLYCFGLLHFKLGQVRNESIQVLKQLSTRAAVEAVITDVVFKWLESTDRNATSSVRTNNDEKLKYNEFECSNRAKIVKLLDRSQSELDNAEDRLEYRFSQIHTPEPRVDETCRAHALEVLKNLPEMAEKRSRFLVPFFLRHSRKAVLEDPEDVDEVETLKNSHTLVLNQQDRLSRRNQLALLEIFGLFLNPRMLYKESEVYAELLNYLCSGDAGIQKAALKALSTWKSTLLQQYAENFNNLLDETRFREELATFATKDEVIMDVGFADILPFLLRLLYGRIISRVGSSSSKASLSTKRHAVFDALARLGTAATEEFTKIALGSLLNLQDVNGKFILPSNFEARKPTQRQQLGLLNLLKDMVDRLGDNVASVTTLMLPAILFCGQHALNSVGTSNTVTEKDVRKSALLCLTSIVSRTSPTVIAEFLPAIVEIFLTPRLETLAVETSQSVSALLQFLAAWTASPERSLWLVDYDSRVLDAVTQTLITPAVKNSVLLFIMNQIIRPLAISAAEEQLHGSRIKQEVLRPNIGHILERIGGLIKSNPERLILASALSLLSSLARSVDGSTNIQMLLQLCASLLAQPASRVSPRSKGDILGILIHFIPLSNLASGNELISDLETSLASLLLYFKDRDNRVQLTNVILVLAQLDHDLKQPADICSDLDAYSTTSVDEPDFDRRLQAFHAIDGCSQSLSAKQWKPLLYSLLYHIQDAEELLIRSSASASLKIFTNVVASTSDDHLSEIFSLIDSIVLPAVRNGASHRSELIRLEYLSIFAEVVKRFPLWDKVSDLSPLLVNEDEEASFFNNILHIQQHRRLRALRRLANETSKGQLRSMNVAHFLIPLLEHFVLDRPDDKSEHNLVFETITTLSKLTLALEWPQFRAMFRRYTTYMLTNPDLEKPAIRLLSMMTDTLSQVTQPNSMQEEQMDVDDGTIHNKPQSHRLGLTLPKGDKLADDVAKSLTIPLREYVHQKDETLVSQRVPVAVTVAKLIMLLSEHQIVLQLPPLLTDICQILRSRVQESRDLARKTLVDISRTVGMEYFGFILKELRTALPRGYQLHVLSFTLHMLLVINEPYIENAELDYCLPHIASIIMDDMFGTTGQEKDAEEYISQMKEVKSNKSYDSMEIVARTSSLGKINSLLQPIMALLEEKLDLRMLKKIDELLRRLGLGLLRNRAINSQAALVLCFELLKQVYGREQRILATPYQDHRKKRFLINMNSIKKSNITHASSSGTHKLARFAFDLLRTVLVRHDGLQTPANLLGFMPAIGEGIMSDYEEVQVSVIRLLGAIMRIPLAELDKNAPVYASEALTLIKNSITMSSESSQAALKLVTVLLRDRENFTIKETDVSYILQRIKTDLEEPDRQGIIFNFLKAVLHRKVIVAGVYEVMDAVAAIMVQNQSVAARNTARTVYVQFLVNYPQGKERLKKQWAFLIKNLGYDFEEGRQSILESIHLLLGKVGDDTAQEIVSTFFAPLVLAIINDSSIDCRKMSALLLKEFFEQANEDTLGKILALLRSWISQDEQRLLLRVALQTLILYIEAEPKKAERDLPLMLRRIEDILGRSDSESAVDEWETVYYTLQLLIKMAQLYPARVLTSSNTNIWKLIVERSRFPHAWVKLASSRALGLYFADFARTHEQVATIFMPLTGPQGLRLETDTMMTVMRSSLNTLKAPAINEELATQLVKNLVFLGRLFDATSTVGEIVDRSDISEEVETDDEENEAEHASVDPLAFSFARISFILRRETVISRAASMIPKTACMRLLVALCSNLSTETLSMNSTSILLPLHIITDSSTSVPFSTDEGFKTAHAALISNAQEMMALLQSKLGTAKFIDALNTVRARIKQKRDDRRIKRRIEAVAEPEKTGYKRTKKRSQQRVKRKDKNSEYRAQRRGW